MADAPQVAYSADYPEAYQKHEQVAPQHYADSPSRYASPAASDAQKQPFANFPSGDPQDRNKILGLRRRNFWIILVLGILVVGGAIIGGSVGGSFAVRYAESKSNALATSTTAPSTIPTSSQASQSASSPSSTPGVVGIVYTPLPFNQITYIDINCPSATYQSGTDMPGFKARYTYRCQNGRNIANGDSDLASFTTYTLQQCIDACSQWNEGRANVSCAAAVISSNLASGLASGNGANCWLKGDAQLGAMDAVNLTSAVLIT